MNYKSSFFLVFLVLLVSCPYAKETNFVGTWNIYNPPENFRGTKVIKITMVNDEYQLLLNGVLKVPAVLSKQTTELFFQISGYGPDGPQEKLIISGEKLQRFTLEGKTWVKSHEYFRDKDK